MPKHRGLIYAQNSKGKDIPKFCFSKSGVQQIEIVKPAKVPINGPGRPNHLVKTKLATRLLPKVVRDEVTILATLAVPLNTQPQRDNNPCKKALTPLRTFTQSPA
jgi:hypothetical protein